jgi:hypothetical protein
MTAAPYASPKRRIAVTAVVSVLLLGAGRPGADEFGIGAALLLFALAAVGLIDLAAAPAARRARRQALTYFCRSSAAAV